ncbi:centriolar and ciliogenesis-associated protein HYLS1 [Hippocampus zosterae]|uniref:centriolar and ciliogenesis-associated protein HYLS1 n=1 Tax=Hippocampus zosterae TaxID=109293 RepID=UPI00223D3E1B|nr:centriolar and ciliogenesis-associated protein HYLS1 [Hippocampus zosterae]
MDNLDFSEEEIQQQLALLGYADVPDHRLREFKRDLDRLIQNGGGPNAPVMSAGDKADPGPPAYTKEKVRRDDGDSPGSGRGGGPAHVLVPDAGGRRFIKRKVLRKREGHSLVCDESIYSQDPDGSALLPDRLSQLRLGEAENHHAGVLSDSEEGVSLSTCMTRSRSESDFRAKPKSFIRPLMMQHTIKKMDPVARYFHYKHLWDQLKLPGERDHRELRWEIRERLAYRPPAPKARRSLAANGYVVPTDKKRSALRWEVRSLMADPHLPHGFI